MRTSFLAATGEYAVERRPRLKTASVIAVKTRAHRVAYRLLRMTKTKKKKFCILMNLSLKKATCLVDFLIVSNRELKMARIAKNGNRRV